MSDSIPRRLIDELITGWRFTGERVLVLEGPQDQRFIRLVQAEEHCNTAFASVLALPADAIEVASDVVERHGFEGTGAKQRVIAFAREIENLGAVDGFRGVVDRDQDPLLMLDYRSQALKYTDLGCMEAYGWSIRACRQLIVQFHCESRVSTASGLRKLFNSVNEICATLAAVRAAALLHRDWDLELHQTASTIDIRGGKALLNLPAYIKLCRPPKNTQDTVAAEVARLRHAAEGTDPLTAINGHDLLWVLVAVLRTLSVLPRRQIDEVTVAGTIVSAGVMDPALFECTLFRELSEWAAA